MNGSYWHRAAPIGLVVLAGAVAVVGARATQQGAIITAGAAACTLWLVAWTAVHAVSRRPWTLAAAAPGAVGSLAPVTTGPLSWLGATATGASLGLSASALFAAWRFVALRAETSEDPARVARAILAGLLGRSLLAALAAAFIVMLVATIAPVVTPRWAASIEVMLGSAVGIPVLTAVALATAVSLIRLARPPDMNRNASGREPE